MKTYLYEDYIIRIILYLGLEWFKPIPTLVEIPKYTVRDNLWWAKPGPEITSTLRMYVAPNDDSFSRVLLLGDNDTSPTEFIKFMAEYAQPGDVLCYGGVGVINKKDGEFILLNWDFAETGDNREILTDLKSEGSAIHSSSSTGEDTGLKIVSNDVLFQEVPWDPHKRESAIKFHLSENPSTRILLGFKDAKKFINGTERSLDWWDVAVSTAKRLFPNNEDLLSLLDVGERAKCSVKNWEKQGYYRDPKTNMWLKK